MRSLNADNGRRGLQWGPDQSFAMQCTGSCRGGAPNQAMHAKFYAFSHTGTARNVVMVSSANLNKGGATLGYNDMFTMRGVPATFALYERVHAEMARDRVDGDPYRVLQDGRFLTQIFPKRGADASSDPTFQTLKRVRCSGATGSAGVRGHTVIRVSMFHWGGDRGVYLAKKLVGLDRAGCVVSVIYGAPSSEVSRILRDSAHRGGIALYDSRVDRNGDHHPDLRVHTKYMLIGGSYGGDTSSWQVFTGSQNWVKQSLTGGDENTLQIYSRADHGRYVDNFDFVRLHGSPQDRLTRATFLSFSSTAAFREPMTPGKIHSVGDETEGTTLRLRRRLLAVLTTCCAVVLRRAAPRPRRDGTPAPRAGAATARPFVIATYNIRHALSDAVATADVQRLAATGVDVIALQEMGSRMRRNAVRAQLVDCATCEFRAYMPDGSGPAEVPFLFRASAFELVSKGTEQVSDATYVGADGAGGSTMGPKYLTYVQLRHVATGRDIYVINSHAVPSVQGPSGGPNYGNPERLALFRQHMDGLIAMVSRFEATGAAVFATGDFNVNYRRDAVVQEKTFPYYRMKQIGMYASYKYAGSPALGSQVDTHAPDRPGGVLGQRGGDRPGPVHPHRATAPTTDRSGSGTRSRRLRRRRRHPPR